MTTDARRTTILLCGIVLTAVLARLAFLFWELRSPGFEWVDPDGYLNQAAALTRDGHWSWTWRAVQYSWGGQWFLPPAYPVFLSAFYYADAPNPLGAAIAQAIVGGLAAVPVYFIGQGLHSTRAGLIAAAIWAAWFPGIVGRNTFIQEQLYLPLQAAALAALVWCLSRSARPAAFAVAGATLGLAALTRAMPLYALPVIVPILVWAGWTGRRGWRWAGAFVAGFCVAVVPYIAALSARAGQLILIDNHGLILFTGEPGRGSFGRMVSLATDVLLGPIFDKLYLARGLFIVYGKNWLYHYGGAASEAGAAWMELFVQLNLNTLFVVVTLLTPVGLLLARQGRVAVLLTAWSLVVIGVSTVAGFSGARYRQPLEVVLICAAAAALAGTWRRPSWPGGVVAALVTVLLAVILLPQYRQSWDMAVPYGLQGWTRLDDGRWETSSSGAIGLYVPVIDGVVAVDLVAGDDPATLRVAIEGVPAEAFHLDAGGAATVRVPLPSRATAFVEVRPEGGGGPTYRVRTLR